MGAGDRIRTIRKMRGLTQKQLAEGVGLTESAVRNYELGLRKPSEAHIAAMASFMDVTPESLRERGNETARDLLELVFRMEDELGLTPIESPDGFSVSVGLNSKGGKKAAQAIKAWKRMRDKLDSGEITQDEYDKWKVSFRG
jgi:transcriptional regulator with XRE-family HTH domain